MIIISLGSNISGVWGIPAHTLDRALVELAKSGIRIVKTSRLYKTRAVSAVPQSDYLNAVTQVDTQMPAHALLQVLERIEAQAGRAKAKTGRHAQYRWRPRPLDLDIVSYKGVICNWKMKQPLLEMRVVLPHGRAHERAFVLQPLAEILPSWHHPVLGLTADEFLKKSRVRETGRVLAIEDFHR